MIAPRGTIDLNADLGEGFPWDDVLLDQVTSASISCGAHAGDHASIEQALRAAARRGVHVGAHPGYPDREGFGRRERFEPHDVTWRQLVDQVRTLQAIAEGLGVRIGYVKPHGALYNQAQRSREVASAVVAAVEVLELPLVGMQGTILEQLAREAGLRYVAEGFADRRYRSDGLLLPRSEPGATLDDPVEVESQVLRLIEAGVETICLHGDDPAALASAIRLRRVLEHHEVGLSSFLTL